MFPQLDLRPIAGTRKLRSRTTSKSLFAGAPSIGLRSNCDARACPTSFDVLINADSKRVAGSLPAWTRNRPRAHDAGQPPSPPIGAVRMHGAGQPRPSRRSPERICSRTRCLLEFFGSLPIVRGRKHDPILERRRDRRRPRRYIWTCCRSRRSFRCSMQLLDLDWATESLCVGACRLCLRRHP